MPDSYNGSPQSVEQLKQNIARSGIVGSLVANDFKSSMIFVPLLDTEPGTGKRIDYHGFSKVLEEKIRAKYELARNLEQVRAKGESPQIKVHVIGFAKLIGELIDGLLKVMAFFAVAALIATAIIYAYTRCVRSTALVIACSLVAVVWQLGPRGALRLRARPLLDPRAVPRVRDRRVARRAEDERHHAGHRPRHASSSSPRATRSGGCSSPG